MVAQAHIDSNTCGSHGSSEQLHICLGDRSACRGCFGLYFPFYVSCFVGGYFMYAIFAAAVFLTCSQQHVVYVAASVADHLSSNIIIYITMPIPPRVIMTEIQLS